MAVLRFILLSLLLFVCLSFSHIDRAKLLAFFFSGSIVGERHTMGHSDITKIHAHTLLWSLHVTHQLLSTLHNEHHHSVPICPCLMPLFSDLLTSLTFRGSWSHQIRTSSNLEVSICLYSKTHLYLLFHYWGTLAPKVKPSPLCFRLYILLSSWGLYTISECPQLELSMNS